MSASTLIPLAEYLQTTYRPDRGYIDGELLERHVGKWEHSRVQVLLATWFATHERQWQVMIATKWRMWINPTRIRIPDLTVVAAAPQPAVLDTPPVLVIEILSPEDTDADTRRRARDYQATGIETIWIIDPETHRAVSAPATHGQRRAGLKCRARRFLSSWTCSLPLCSSLSKPPSPIA